MRILSALIVFFLISTSQAQEFALTAGLRNNNAETDLASATVEAKTSFYLGALAFFPMISPFAFRTGLIYSQRYADIVFTNGSFDEIRFSYLDIPLTLMARFNEYVGVFAGPILAINQSKECSRSVGGVCNALDVKSSIMPITLGASFKFAPQMGGEFFYEFYSGDMARGISNMKSLGANFVFYFE